MFATAVLAVDGDSYRLTGINEPGAHLVLAPKARYNKVGLYAGSRDPEAERWTGPRKFEDVEAWVATARRQ